VCRGSAPSIGLAAIQRAPTREFAAHACMHAAAAVGAIRFGILIITQMSCPCLLLLLVDALVWLGLYFLFIIVYFY
jgi:hypothetical protein